MKFEAEVSALQRTPMFQGVDPSRLRLLAFMGEDRTFKDGEYVVRQGESSDNAYLILDGKADVVVEFGDSASVVAQLGESEVFGEIAMLCETPRTASVRAHGAMRTLMFAREGMLFESHFSSAPWPLPAPAALFTSVPDSVHGLVDPVGLRLADEWEPLPESFQRAGYRTAGFFAGPYLHPSFGFGQGFV